MVVEKITLDCKFQPSALEAHEYSRSDFFSLCNRAHVRQYASLKVPMSFSTQYLFSLQNLQQGKVIYLFIYLLFTITIRT